MLQKPVSLRANVSAAADKMTSCRWTFPLPNKCLWEDFFNDIPIDSCFCLVENAYHEEMAKEREQV